MDKPALISVIVTSYNWPEALGAVLLALDHQTDANFEVLIADDGSRPEVVSTIHQQMARCHFSVQLIGQEDRGFRAAKIRNQAAVKANGAYLVFLDGDCVPRPDFIARHRALAEAAFWVPGNRILLSQPMTKALLSRDFPDLKCSTMYWWLQRLRGNINRVLPLLYWPFSTGRKGHLSSWKGAKTCNLGVWKADFFRVNGFDERYEGWGYEDSDFIIRLIRAGIYRKSGKFALPVFHLWHTEQARDLEPNNHARLQTVMASKVQRAAIGVDQYE